MEENTDEGGQGHQQRIVQIHRHVEPRKQAADQIHRGINQDRVCDIDANHGKDHIERGARTDGHQHTEQKGSRQNQHQAEHLHEQIADLPSLIFYVKA